MLGTIKIGRDILCEDVPVWVVPDATANAASWSGRFVPDEDAADRVRAAVDAGETCRLHLDDGRSGDIVLQGIAASPQITAEFTGLGALA
jgi:hypothetical protein